MGNALTFRQQLEPVLLPWLGSYTLANGTVTPAFSVRAIGKGLAPGTTVSGVEAVLRLDPDLAPVSAYQSEEALATWTCYLVDWTGEEELTGAAQAVIDVFPGSTWSQLNVSEDVGPSNQVRLTIKQRQSLPHEPRAMIVIPAADVAFASPVPSVEIS